MICKRVYSKAGISGLSLKTKRLALGYKLEKRNNGILSGPQTCKGRVVDRMGEIGVILSHRDRADIMDVKEISQVKWNLLAERRSNKIR